MFKAAINRLKASLSPKEGATAKDNPQERRRHRRYDLSEFDNIFIELSSGTLARIQDISYGGFSAHLDDTTSLPATGSQAIKIHFLGTCCDAECVVTYKGHQSFGASFIHATAETLIYLRPILEAMRCGSSTVEIAASMRNSKYQDQSWLIYRGEGPTDIRIHTNPQRTTLIEAQLTYLESDRYFDLHYEGGRLTFSQSVDKSGTSARMETISQPPSTIIRQAIQVLLGAYSQHKLTCFQDWIGICLKQSTLQPPKQRGAS